MSDKNKILINILIGIIAVQAFLLFLFIVAKKPKTAVVRPVTPTVIKGKIAIVVDDWGYESKNINLLEEIKQPFTISILPNLAYSSKAYQDAIRAGKETILHFPLEPHPHPADRLEKDTVLINMPDDKIRSILDQALASFPSVKGISNHMGSRATEDTKTMKIIFEELKKRKMYFLDSFVTPKSICKKLAKTMNLSFAMRSVFLDNKPDSLYIKRQLRLLVKDAARKGFAVGIGHDRSLTLSILKEQLPLIEKEGYKFVYLSQVVE